jgi:hypothetical protein
MHGRISIIRAIMSLSLLTNLKSMMYLSNKPGHLLIIVYDNAIWKHILHVSKLNCNTKRINKFNIAIICFSSYISWRPVINLPLPQPMEPFSFVKTWSNLAFLYEIMDFKVESLLEEVFDKIRYFDQNENLSILIKKNS